MTYAHSNICYPHVPFRNSQKRRHEDLRCLPGRASLSDGKHTRSHTDLDM